MKYVPPDKNESTRESVSSFDPESIPVSDTTKFIRWGTQVEKDDIVDKTFISKHRNLVAIVNKWLPLANYNKRDMKQKQLERLRRMEIELYESAGLVDDAETVVIDSWGDAQFSRGVDGFYTKELNTQRQKVKDETEHEESKKRGFFKNKKEKPENRDGEIRW